MKKILSIILAAAMLVCVFASCAEKTENVLICKDSDGKESAGIDRNLLSLIVAVVNYQLGADSLEDDMWDMEYQEGNGTTVKEIVIAQSRAYAEGLLQAEYLCDKVYKIGLSDKQKDSVSSYISELSAAYGSNKSLENALSVYGASIESLTRYMELILKQDTVYSSFYSENGIREAEIDSKKAGYFEEHFAIADHILVKYSGGLKDDGTEIPITDEEKQAKREAAKALYNEINVGVRDFDQALEAYNDDTYKLGYPFGYFIPDSFYWTGISVDVQNAVLEMKEGEIRFIDTEDGAYIIRRNKMDSSLYASNGGFETYLESTLAQEDFLSLCESSCTVSADEEMIAELDPSLIPSFNIDALGGTGN